VIAWPVFIAVVASAGWAPYLVTGSVLDSLYSSVSTVLHAVVVYGVTWMVRSMAELRATRIQLAKVAVAEERLRFARDLHDLLGLSLSAITLKTELAHRLVTAAPEKARDELNEILAISRLALADVRLVASGYRDLSLDDEFRTAESLLAAADVNVLMDLKVRELPGQVGTLLATVLREGVTNVLRHSKGERCEITVERHQNVVYLDIVNDGVAESPARRTNGSGISNLSYRVALFGGELTAGVEPDGRFRLRAKVPA
jgi:signal transduction histidine kinase